METASPSEDLPFLCLQRPICGTLRLGNVLENISVFYSFLFFIRPFADRKYMNAWRLEVAAGLKGAEVPPEAGVARGQ